MTKFEELTLAGQSIWFDFIRRSLLESGELAELVAEGVQGVTSNPAIFAQAIAGSSDYDGQIGHLARAGRSEMAIYEALAIADIAAAADILSPVYHRTGGNDGYVSLEVNPALAHQADKTIAEAKRLFAAVGRPNVMIKVPATQAGLTAVTDLIAAGINVNVTLIFGLKNYCQAAEAYISGLEKLANDGPAIDGGHGVDRVASVASFFVSRLDTAVDQLLAEKGHHDLQGKIAVANAKMVYREFQAIFNSDRWDQLAAEGARIQRVLWASTGTKNDAYSDTLYVDELIGPNTVNTLPPKTLDCFRDHGTIAETITQRVDEAEAQLARLSRVGIDLAAITAKLQKQGVAAFAEPFETLLKEIAAKKVRLLTP
jgi:transaldolase